MKKSSLAKALCLMLAILMLVPTLCSCLDKDPPEPDSTSQQSNEDTGNNGTVDNNGGGEDDLQAILGFGPENNSNYKFTMLVSDTDEYEHKATRLTDDYVNDAIFKRNKAVEDFFQIELNVKTAAGDYTDKYIFTDKVCSPILSGDHEHDLIVGVSATVADMLGNQYFLPVNKINYIDLSKEWWLPDQYEDLQINSNIYSLYGDMNLSRYSKLHCFIFNTQLINRYGLTSPYKMVENNTWTYSNMVKQTVAVGHEQAGNGVNISSDVFGMIGSTNTQRALLTGFGLEILTRDTATGKPIFPTSLSSTYIGAYNMVSNAFKNNEYNFLQTKIANDDYSTHLNALAQNRCLHLPAYTYWLTDPILTNMSGQFGVAPYPKLSTSQPQYYSQIATGATVTLFPRTLIKGGEALSAKVATYMSYIGKHAVADKYFESYLGERLTSSADMQNMLRTIKETATVTLTTAYHAAYENTLLSIFGSCPTDFGSGIGDEYLLRRPNWNATLRYYLSTRY